ncbi:MarR family winged helix-turn-helix transcriptional regulator [Nonomuraea pusilla]|uniref:DNA-binding transcriptional regulator, MarR family n=1 Tax=Nonomuraea pusilla TaxID=46177 RepID=A0A1H7GWI5_9ACTN|nr:MarR family transcriptional regulator [Nonomuraea pusilla]SEK42533.1 DNA-binding transcriptional regulator, MarR family [Nonomuraea pusilla]
MDISEHRKNLLEALVWAGRETSNAAVMYHTAMSGLLGLGPSEWKTLDLLQRHGPLTAGELAQHTGLAPASVSGLVDRLEAKELVRRVRDTKDRRRTIVEFVPDTFAGSAHVFEPLLNGLAELHAEYTDEQLELILGYLTRAAAIQRAATAELERLR